MWRGILTLYSLLSLTLCLGREASGITGPPPRICFAQRKAVGRGLCDPPMSSSTLLRAKEVEGWTAGLADSVWQVLQCTPWRQDPPGAPKGWRLPRLPHRCPWTGARHAGSLSSRRDSLGKPWRCGFRTPASKEKCKGPHSRDPVTQAF